LRIAPRYAPGSVNEAIRLEVLLPLTGMSPDSPAARR